MGQHGAHVREVEPLLALAVGKLDLVLRQVRARLDGQAGKPGRGRVEDPSHQLVPSIKERIVNRFPIFVGDTMFVNYRIAELRDSKSKPTQAIAIFDVEVVTHDDRVVQRGRKALLVSKVPLTAVEASK